MQQGQAKPSGGDRQRSLASPIRRACWRPRADACGAATTEHITFDPEGTFTTASGGKPTAAGFWHLVLDNLDLHMVTSPAFFDDPATAADDALSAFAGHYAYFYAKALLFDVEQDSFRTVAAMGNMLRGANYHRCP